MPLVFEVRYRRAQDGRFIVRCSGEGLDVQASGDTRAHALDRAVANIRRMLFRWDAREVARA